MINNLLKIIHLLLCGKQRFEKVHNCSKRKCKKCGYIITEMKYRANKKEDRNND